MLGLAKKIWIADSLAGIANPIFNAVAQNGQPMLFEAWAGALSYTLQLYFDFSAYSDMAIGLSLLFNVRLPLNFNSPYKATSIIEFWRRWHMTLSRYLRDYLYIPLGGSRKGRVRRHVNLMVTMLLGGFWHGAGWTFIAWGGLHGFFLVLNHGWRAFKKHRGWGDEGAFGRGVSGALTFIAVVVGWVFFRSDRITSARVMLEGMAGMNGISLPEGWLHWLGRFVSCPRWMVPGKLLVLAPLSSLSVGLLILFGLAVVWGMPNLRQLFAKQQPTCEDLNEKEAWESQSVGGWGAALEWRDSKLQGAIYGLIFLGLIAYMASAGKSEFLYFQF